MSAGALTAQSVMTIGRVSCQDSYGVNLKFVGQRNDNELVILKHTFLKLNGCIYRALASIKVGA